MTIKSDKWIIAQCKEYNMIVPYVTEQVKLKNGEKIISYGVSSYGYDIRVADEFKMLSPQTTSWNSCIDPKYESSNFETFSTDVAILPAHSFLLCRSLEKFKIPRDVLAICVGKSTYARCGLIVNVTPLEPEWEGYLTIEISNTTPLPARIYANEGIAQLLFYKSDEPCSVSYKDKAGKYQNQVGVVGAKL